LNTGPQGVPKRLSVTANECYVTGQLSEDQFIKLTQPKGFVPGEAVVCTQSNEITAMNDYKMHEYRD